MTGKFYVIEGIDGAGKSSVIKALSKIPNFNAYFTKEPYTEHFVNKLKYAHHPSEKVLLFALDRAYHVKYIIEPQLMLYHHVISDRFVLSNIVYQTYDTLLYSGNHNDLNEDTTPKLIDLISSKEEISSVQLPYPSITTTFLLTVDPQEAVSRCKSKNELEDIHRLTKLQTLYCIYKPDNIITINTTKLTSQEVSTIIYNEITKGL